MLQYDLLFCSVMAGLLGQALAQIGDERPRFHGIDYLACKIILIIDI